MKTPSKTDILKVETLAKSTQLMPATLNRRTLYKQLRSMGFVPKDAFFVAKQR